MSTTQAILADPRYPIGRFSRPETITPEDRDYAVEGIALLPERLRIAAEDMHEDQIDEPYREGGWTVRQLIHHIADSHMQAFSRFRFALTQDNPTIKPYDEALWADLHDSRTAPAEWSLELIESLHARWVMLLNHLTPEQWQRTYNHPETGPHTLEQATLLYAWHGRHHTAHITHLRTARGW